MYAGRTSSGPCSLPWSFGHGDIMRFGKTPSHPTIERFPACLATRIVYVYWTCA